MTTANLPPRAGYIEVEMWDGQRVYCDVRTRRVISDADSAPTAEDRLAALEDAMLAMMGVTSDV